MVMQLIKKIFSSNTDRSKQNNLERRRAFRNADKVILTINTEINRLRNSQNSLWAEARTAKLNGQNMASRRALQRYRAQEGFLSSLDMKKWGFEQILSKMRLADTDQSFSEALQGLTNLTFSSPEKLENVLETINMKIEDLGDTTGTWESIGAEHLASAEGVLTLDELESQLEDEVVSQRNNPSSATLRYNSVS